MRGCTAGGMPGPESVTSTLTVSSGMARTVTVRSPACPSLACNALCSRFVQTWFSWHDRLNQVWTNLVHNALQSMATHGTLTLRIRTSGAGGASGDDHVSVSIGDSGPGVPAAVREHIFEPFFTTKPTGQGSGLGLSICKKIVEEHGGRIDVESVPGRTVFCVTLPRRAVHRPVDGSPDRGHG